MTGAPATRFVHPRARLADGEHDYSLEIASDSVPNYLRWIGGLCRPYLGESVLDVGAGHGAVTQHFVDRRYLTALDPSEACVSALELRFRDRPHVRIMKGDLRDLDRQERFDSIVMINVLEHIQDDCAALTTCLSHLEPDGNIVLYVPALNGLYTDWDRKVGHFRRYSKSRLKAVVDEAGLVVAEMRYVNLLALPAWLVTGKLLKSDSTIGPTLKLWDRTGTLVSKALESRIRVPIGLNLFCVARVPSPSKLCR